jgi:hypothetical protein
MVRKDILKVSDGGYQFALVLPINFDPSKKYLLSICLHGLAGNSVNMAADLSYYTRYMNMILACPYGNIQDPTSKSLKWGYENSDEYILKFNEFIKKKYNVYPEVFLIGFSQGGNQGLHTVMKYPEVFAYFAGLSGGYTKLNELNSVITFKTKIVLLSGDKGSGEIYVKKMQDRAFTKLKKKFTVTRKVIPNLEHKISPAIAYSAFRWYLDASEKFKKTFWLYNGDYVKNFQKGEDEFAKSNFSGSIKHYRKSLSQNPFFPPAAIRYSQSHLLEGKMSRFEKSLFPSLTLYSNFPYFNKSPVKETINYYKDLLSADASMQSYAIRFLNAKLQESEEVLSPEYNMEIYELLSYLYDKTNSAEESKTCKEKANKYKKSIE